MWKLEEVRNLLRNPVEPNLALRPGLPHLLQNLLRNPLPDLTLHQSLPHLLQTLLKLTRLCTKASQAFSGNFSGTFSGILLTCTKASWNLLRNLLRNPAEPDLALHQSFAEPSSEPKPPGTFSGTFSPGTFSGTLLNLTWLCTEASQTFSGTFSGTLLSSAPKPPRPSPEPFPILPGTFSGTLLNLTWLCTKASQTFYRTFSGTFSRTLTWLCTKASQTFSGTFGTFSGTTLTLTRCLHQCTPELFWAEDPISLRCCFGGLPNSRNVLFLKIFLKRAAKPSAGTFSGTHWTRLGFAPRLPGAFSATFSGTLLNLTWLCTKASQTFSGTSSPEPSSKPCWTWPASAPKPPRTFSGTFSRTTWPVFAPILTDLLRNLLRNPVEPDLALHQSLPDLHQNLLRNPVEPDLALHQSLLDLTWLCTKASWNLLRNLLRNLFEPDPAPAPAHTGAILGWRPH